MSKLPVVKPRDVISFLEKNGFYHTRTDGSHFRFHHKDGRNTTVAFHRKPIPKGTLKSILRQAELTTEQLLEML